MAKAATATANLRAFVFGALGDAFLFAGDRYDCDVCDLAALVPARWWI